MRHKIILSVTLVLIGALSTSIMAQLKVYSGGGVKIEEHLAIGTDPSTTKGLILTHTNNTFDPYYGIHSTVKVGSIPTGPVCAIYGYADGYTTGNNYPVHPTVGVLGIGRKNYTCPNALCAGVVGLANYYGGIGVYGSCNGMFYSCTAAGTLHTTSANKDSWDGVMGPTKTWSTWTTAADWTD